MLNTALDIVLLPPPQLMQQALALNAQLPASKIQLHAQDALPHVTLAMGAVRDTAITGLISDIINGLGRFEPMALTVQGVYKHELPTGELITGLALGKTKKLEKLQHAAYDLLEHMLVQDFDGSAFANEDDGTAETIAWTRDFAHKSSGQNYHPHITIGYGQPDYSHIIGQTFTFETVALYQLGSYCTCRVPIFDFQLQEF